jgi:sialidase-1
MRQPTMLLLLSIAVIGTAAEGPVFTDLFTARAGGYATYRIPGIVVTAKGSILAYAEARRHGIGDWDPIDLLLRRSADGGSTWSEPQLIARDGDLPMHNQVAIAARDGTVHLLYCSHYERCFYRRSDDDGQSFSPPVDITAAFAAFRPEVAWNVIATGPGHGIELANGRLVVPVWLSTGGKAHRPSMVASIVSDDHGATWVRGQVLPATLVNPSETVAVQLADGSVLFNVRHETRARPEQRRRAISISPDGASAWSPFRFDDALLEPVCMGSIVRLDEGGGRGRVAFANPDSLDNAFSGGRDGRAADRKNLTIRLSADEAHTWPQSRVLEPGVAGYSDLAAGKDGTIWCFYECGANGSDMFDTGVLRLARVTAKWVEEGTRQPALPAGHTGSSR